MWRASALVACTVACNGLIGIGDYRPCAGAECGDDSGASGDATGDVLEEPAPGGLVTLATGLTKPDALGVDAQNVYFATFLQAGTVYDCPVAGCTNGVPTTLATGQIGVDDLSAASGSLYWVLDATSGAVRGCNASGCIAKTYTTAPAPTTIVATDTTVYWADDDGIRACDVASCAPSLRTLVASGGPKASIAVDAVAVYWSGYASGEIDSCPLAGCASPAVIAAQQGSPGHVAVDATSVYWTANLDGTVSRCAKTGCTSPQVLAGGLAGPWGLAIDDTDVFWTNNNADTVMKCAKTGCTAPTVLASGQAGPYAIAVDATSVYWTTDANGTASAGTVMKLTPK